MFLRHLWATDGNVTVPRTRTAPKVYYASSSRALADGVALLLSRFGIIARIRQVTKAGYRPGFHVIVADGPSLQTFCRSIGVHGARGKLAVELATYLEGRVANTNTDTLPLQIWDLVKCRAHPRGLTERQVPGGHRDAFLREHPLQGLPVTRAVPALRGGAGFRGAERGSQQRHLLGPDRHHRAAGPAARLRRHRKRHP